jgi:hypothetical protein
MSISNGNEMKKEAKLIATHTAPEGVVNIYDNGLLETFINEGSYIDVRYLREGRSRLEKLNLPGKFYVIAEGGFYQISREARKLCADKEYSANLAAVAVVLKHTATKIILELFLKIDKPVVPTKGFTSREQAFEWLEKMRGANTTLVSVAS